MYTHVFVAGTFDGLHAGHRFLLTRAFTVGEKVTIGLTSSSFISKYKSKFLISKSQTNPNTQNKKTQNKTIQTFFIRKKHLAAWLTAQEYRTRATIIPISDPYEPAASMAHLDGLIVTQENRKTGERINALRQSLALPPLTLIEVPMVKAEDGAPISSTRMRNGEIDYNGKLIMPECMRGILGRPLGKVLAGDAIDHAIRQNRGKFIITVGDVATKTLLDAGITPYLAIIDGKVGRKPFHEVIDLLQSEKVSPCLAGRQAFQAKAVKSGPGYISREAIKKIQKVFTHSPIHPFTHHTLVINGEEDLLVLPAITHAPFGSILYYGQPGDGLVEVVITQESQKTVRDLLLQFEGQRD